MRIAKEDIKLAEEYYKQCMKKMLQTQQAQTAQNQQDTFKAQQAAAVQKGKQDLANMKAELGLKADADKEASKNRMKEIVLQGAFSVMSSKEGDVKPEWQPVIQELVHNIMLPLLKDNIGHTAALGETLSQQPPQGQDQNNQQQIQQPQPQQQMTA